MNQRGQTTLEFALTAGIFFLFLLALIDLAVMFYVNLTMENAVREGVRHVITGQEKHEDLRRSLQNTISSYSSGLYEKNAYPGAKSEPAVFRLDSRKFANYSGVKLEDTGGAGQLIMVRLTYSWPLLTPFVRPFFKDGKYTFTVRTTMRNEPWVRNEVHLLNQP